MGPRAPWSASGTVGRWLAVALVLLLLAPAGFT